MLSRRAMLLWLAAGTLGCKGVCLQTSSKVQMNYPPTGPVMRQTVQRGPCSPSGPRIAILEVDGLLMNVDLPGLIEQAENPVGLFREKLDRIRSEGGIRAVVLRINSPGGGVTASDIMRHELARFREQTQIPVVTCILDVGAGGGYYLATATDQIVAHPTSLVGGIGVILNLYNLQDAMAQFNVIPAPVKSGERIDLGSPVAGLDDVSRQLLQQMADEFHARFKQIVLDSRPQLAAGQKEIFDGRVFTAGQAHRLGLIDTIGYLDDAINIARELGGCPQAEVVMYHRASDRAFSPYATSIAPSPIPSGLVPLSIPGLDRSRMPTFLYLWQSDPTIEKHMAR